MSELLLSKTTNQQLKALLSKPPHAILVSGEEGSGKLTIGMHLSASLLGITENKLQNYPYFLKVERSKDKQEISIDQIRSVIKHLKLKPVTKDQPIKRVIFINESHLLSAEAQNALLKAIEEPPAATVFILSATSENAVLPTIASRTQKLLIGTISLEEAINFFKDNYDNKTITSAWQLSGGAVGLLTALLLEDKQHSLKKAVEDAKNIITLNKYERAMALDSLSSNKAEFARILDALGRVISALHHSAVVAANDKSAAKFLIARKQIQQALDCLEKNVSAKLIALDLALQLPF
ncbi:hypothetical protein KW794_00010 [Candidatus Saccharibacteria bacterium]|nr:hypothetical protein [Candidatus Saccharibacteria bacterium]